MDINLIAGWVASVLLLIVSIFLLMGKESFLNLLAGYNTASGEKKAKYDKLKLCRVAGGGILIISLILMIFCYYQLELPSYLDWLIPWGILGVALVMIILGNTICRKK